MSLRMFVVVVAAAVYMAGQSDAINCYVCVGSGNDACTDGYFDASSSLVSDISGCSSCSTASSSAGVARVCASSSIQPGCTTQTLGGVTVETCYCDTDHCNAGTGASENGASVPMAAAVTLTAFTLVAKMFM